MKPERRDLLHDVLAADQQREAVLLAGGKILRRKRHIRFATRSLGIVAVAALVIISVQHRPTPPSAPVIASANVDQMIHLTDDELLALFPGTPVGLGTAAGKSILIFPRPGDEALFVSRPRPTMEL